MSAVLKIMRGKNAPESFLCVCVCDAGRTSANRVKRLGQRQLAGDAKRASARKIKPIRRNRKEIKCRQHTTVAFLLLFYFTCVQMCVYVDIDTPDFILVNINFPQIFSFLFLARVYSIKFSPFIWQILSLECSENAKFI
jgi:hypothetical protein